MINIIKTRSIRLHATTCTNIVHYSWQSYTRVHQRIISRLMYTYLVEVGEVVIWSHHLWVASVGSYHSLEMFPCSRKLPAQRPPWCAADMWPSLVGWPCPLSLHTLSQCKGSLFCSSSGYLPWYQTCMVGRKCIDSEHVHLDIWPYFSNSSCSGLRTSIPLSFIMLWH